MPPRMLEWLELGPSGSLRFSSACYFDIRVSMSKQETLISKKRRGPVPKEPTIPLLVRCSPALLDRLDRWIGKQADPLTRPAAVRRLLERTLKP
jgi:hypothetical protein